MTREQIESTVRLIEKYWDQGNEHAGMILVNELAAAALAAPVAAEPPSLVLENIAMAARRALAFGHQATPQTPERMVERKEQALRQILELTGVQSSPLRTPAQAEPAAPDRFTASEALYAFAGWLTTRDEPTVMAAAADAAVVGERVAEFCARHGLAKPRDGWENLIIPAALPASSPAAPRTGPGIPAPDGFQWIKRSEVNAAGNFDTGWYLYPLPASSPAAQSKP